MQSDEWFERLAMHNFVDGRMVRSQASEEVPIVEPATEARLGASADTPDDEIDHVVACANRAQREWRKRDGLTRADALHEVARRLREKGPVIAELMTREMGKPYKEALDEMEWGASAFSYYAELGRNDQGRVLGPNVEMELSRFSGQVQAWALPSPERVVVHPGLARHSRSPSDADAGSTSPR